MLNSLWGEEFVVATPPQEAKKIIDKVSNPKRVSTTTEKAIKSKKLTLDERLAIIEENVLRILGKYKENTQVITTKQELVEYIDRAIINGEIAIDTETNNSLDPITCKIMGPCIYTPGMKNAYIPINHINRYTGERLGWQLTEEDVREQFARLTNTNIIMHNGKFDYQVIKCTCGIALKVYWDTLIGARILNEDELAGLKTQYIQKIDSSIQKYDIEHLFANVEYAVVDPNLFALYAATDAFMTYRLYEWQKRQFETPDCARLYDLFMNVEMPVMEVAAEMELTGICIDKEYAHRLSLKYHKKLDAIDRQIEEELLKLAPTIREWRMTPDANYHPPGKKAGTVGKSKSEQLSDPVQVTSPTQLAILIYDVLKHPVVDKDSPRGTGEDILKKIELPLCRVILEKRGVEKLLGTYIDKLPDCVCEKDGKLHAHFNQVGTDTGRFSSSDPNLQNIPSHEKAIRMMFKAADGNVFVGSDFSQQEPRLLSHYSGDENMINAYKQGKDLYATIASGVYKMDYWDCMEKHEDGTPNPDGKKRRSSVKGLLLGIMYGMGAASIAILINGTLKEAQKIIDDFYGAYPKVKQWIDRTQEDAKKNLYVEDFYGRRRRLKDLGLPLYTVRYKDKTANVDFNPLLHCKGIVTNTKSPLIERYTREATACTRKNEVAKVKERALKDGIEVLDNGGYIARAERQCVNARVQGGAATMSKIAMIQVYNSQELRELGFKIVLQIHDELIGECPEENADKAAEILTSIMKDCVKDYVTVPFKCDPDISPCWYYSDYSDTLKKEYNERLEKGDSPESAFAYFVENNSECTIEQLKEMIYN